MGSLQKTKRALWFTDALLWNFPSTKPLLSCSEQRATQTFPGDQLWTERQKWSDHSLTVTPSIADLYTCFFSVRCTWSLSCLMFFSMCGSSPLKVNSWMNCLMWSWSFRVRHAPWLPAPPDTLSGSLAPFFRSVLTAVRVCRLPELLGVSSWRGWLSRLLDTASGRKQVS